MCSFTFGSELTISYRICDRNDDVEGVLVYGTFAMRPSTELRRSLLKSIIEATSEVTITELGITGASGTDSIQYCRHASVSCGLLILGHYVMSEPVSRSTGLL